jgi:hypothetical protein
MAIAVEQKLNGFRALAQKKGDQVRIEFEDNRRDVSAKLPPVVKAVRKLDKDVVLDCSLGIVEDGKPWPRIRLMTLTAGKPVIPEGAQLLLTAFDILYDGEDVTDLPLSERRKRLEAVVRRINDKHVDVSQQIVVRSKPELEKAAKKLAGMPGSEGVVVKEWESKYPKGKATSTWAKCKSMVELKVIVLERKQTKHGMQNYRCGLLLGVGKYSNVVEVNGKKYVDLKWSFNTPINAKAGGVLTVEVEEIILRGDELNWLGPSVVDVDKNRKEPYYAQQVVGMAKRGHILQDARVQQAIVMEIDGRVLQGRDLADGTVERLAKEMEEGETRGEKSAAFWKAHWQECLPMSGEGVFVYQRHWRGLSKEEAELSEEELLKTDHSVHGDLRCSFDNALWGFSVFLGETADVRGGRTLEKLSHEDALQGQFKLAQPKEWLTVARKKPFISEPGGPGSTSKTWAVFFEIDHGSYEIGVAHRSFIELFMKGKSLRGRYMIQKAADPGGRRYWQIVRPESQKPYAEEHDKGTELKRLKGRGHKIVFWSRPGEKLERIELATWKGD